MCAHFQPDEGSSPAKTVLRIGAVQVPLRQDKVHPLQATRAVIELMVTFQQVENKIELFVLPELCPVGYTEQTFREWLPKTPEIVQVYEKIHQDFCKAAVELQAFICFGTIGRRTDPNIPGDNGSNVEFTIRQVVVNPQGETVAVYDKMHLCDYGDCAETRFFSSGRKECSFDCFGFRCGILICADMRNPSLSRRLAAVHKVDVLIQPAAFGRDLSFRTWRSFRETRAVENSVYWIGVNYASSQYGNTSFTEPWVDEDHESRIMGCEPGVLVGNIERGVLARVRSSMPYYKQLLSEDWWSTRNLTETTQEDSIQS